MFAAIWLMSHRGVLDRFGMPYGSTRQRGMPAEISGAAAKLYHYPIIARQTKYSLVFAIPCVVQLWTVASRLQQPHDFCIFLFNESALARTVFPHVH